MKRNVPPLGGGGGIKKKKVSEANFLSAKERAKRATEGRGRRVFGTAKRDQKWAEKVFKYKFLKILRYLRVLGAASI